MPKSSLSLEKITTKPFLQLRPKGILKKPRYEPSVESNKSTSESNKSTSESNKSTSESNKSTSESNESTSESTSDSRKSVSVHGGLNKRSKKRSRRRISKRR